MGKEEAADADKPVIDTKAADEANIKVPSDLTKVSNNKAKELAEAGVVEDRDLPGKWYKRKVDGFMAKIPNYIYDAYIQAHKDEWDEVKLTTDAETK